MLKINFGFQQCDTIINAASMDVEFGGGLSALLHTLQDN